VVITPHATVGAALGKTLARQRPLLALGLGVLSHYLLDQVPHRDYDLYAPNGKTFVGLELLTVAAVLSVEGYAPATYAGALGGVLPDVVALLAPNSLPSRLHGRLHPDFTASSGRLSTLTQSLTALSAIFCLRCAK
jgi:hypothetical protein